MKCPICRKPTRLGEPDSPFCSERCRLIDLGNWSSEEYVISTPLRPDDANREAARSEDDSD
ncbi:MAG TPA: DNA gyrase inhibitor YacG [Bryobacteraceae bacterium]|nr:DNA gyrase inhibitor YacG [Bryobacteraceae bacterium]